MARDLPDITLPDLHREPDLPAPGSFPYTRGIHETMYRRRLWTMRQFSGFSTPQETNRRYRYLLEQGQTGLSVAFDLPTLMGYDADHALAHGEVGKCGASVSSLEDMETLFDGIPLDQVSVSMTINSPAAVIWAMYLAVARRQGVDFARLSGTLQNDILKEYIAQKEYIFPPKPSMRLVTDTVEFATRKTPRFNPISISGYHIREAGSTALQELAFTLRDGLEYVDWALERGLAIDEFAPRLSFFFNAHNNFFEEIAKYRAARTLWAVLMREHYGARDERSWKLRFHAQTAGCSLTWQQPYNNVVRTSLQAMAAVLGGAQSLHTNSLDEAWALPGEHAATLALRTQQVIAFESGVAGVPDPFGGSEYLERLTLEMENGARDYIRAIDEKGGMIAAIEQGFPQAEIARASFEYQQKVEKGEAVIVGVNRYRTMEEQPIETLRIDRSAEDRQIEKLRQLRKTRNNGDVECALNTLRRAAAVNAADRKTDLSARQQSRQDLNSGNLMPPLLDAVEARATLGEICGALREVFGTYEERPHI
jgi:methylmalonyl-CoA mutase N-terminal domain/subunit